VDPDGNQPAEYYGAEAVRSQYAGGRLVLDYCYSCAHYRASTAEETRAFLRGARNMAISSIGTAAVCYGTLRWSCVVAGLATVRDVGVNAFQTDIAYVAADTVNEGLDLGYSSDELTSGINKVDTLVALVGAVKSLSTIDIWKADLQVAAEEGTTLFGIYLLSYERLQEICDCGDDSE